jgi:5-dehydro-2-deoxygluconokinase
LVITAALAPSRAATLAALRAREGGTVILDLDHRPMFWASADEATVMAREALQYATVAVGNREEVEIAVGTGDPDAAADRLLEAGVEIAIVKQGPGGVLVATREGRSSVPPVPTEVVCGLGAGDAFGGSLAYGLLQGWPPERAVRMANAAGSIVASRLACADAMPTLEELEGVLA